MPRPEHADALTDGGDGVFRRLSHTACESPAAANMMAFKRRKKHSRSSASVHGFDDLFQALGTLK